MKFDVKYPFGANPPYCEYRRLLVHMDTQFSCVKCGCLTNWVLVPLMTATCSEECLNGQVKGQTKETKCTNDHSEHWLTLEGLRDASVLLQNRQQSPEPGEVAGSS